MIRKFLSRRGLMAFGSIVGVTILFSACKKNNDDRVQTPAAALMAFNLVPDQPSVQIALSGNPFPGAPLAYPNFTGQYLNIFAGNRVVAAYSTANSQRLDSVSYTFEPNKYYSLFVVGANNSYKNIVAVDNYDSLTASSGKAYIRYINAVPNTAASNVSISSGGASVVNTNAAFGSVSEFVPVTPGEISINVTNEGSVNASRTIAVAQQKAYTILLSGLPNQTDSSKAVQIRYVLNGTVTD